MPIANPGPSIIYGKLTDNGGHWVMCDLCSCWSHSACNGLSAELARSEAFHCYFCSPALGFCISASRFLCLGSHTVPLSVFGEIVLICYNTAALPCKHIVTKRL